MTEPVPVDDELDYDLPLKVKRLYRQWRRVGYSPQQALREVVRSGVAEDAPDDDRTGAR